VTASLSGAAVEIGEEVEHWRRLDDQVAPILLVLAPPDELRVEVAMAPLIGEPDRRLVPPRS